jgi:hypothetical protein
MFVFDYSYSNDSSIVTALTIIAIAFTVGLIWIICDYLKNNS